jgi:hypothetical protein
MRDVEFLAALEDASLPEQAFRHLDHMRAAYLYLSRDGFAAGVGVMSAALRRYAASRGKPDRYHETMTVAYLALINERLVLGGDAGGFDAFVGRNPDLVSRDLLARYYRPEILSSDRARRVFVLQDL